MFDTLRFASPGIPSTTRGGTGEGIKEVARLGLNALELEFVHSVNVTAEKAAELKAIKEKNDVTLTCHAPYYINLNSQDNKKFEASKKRLLHAALIADNCGAFSITFHPAFYVGLSKEETFENVKQALLDVQQSLDSEGASIRLSPETTGKPSQFGELKELLALSKELENMAPCIDYSHLHARSNGLWNTKEEFSSVHEQVEQALGKKALQELHCHISGIAYGPKGEQHHLNLEESDMKYEHLLQSWKDFKVRGVAVSESPNREGDALLLKKLWEQKR